MIILEILKYTLPSFMILVAVYYLAKQQNQKDISLLEKRNDKEIRDKNQEVLLPIRLQAHERLILFLERIHPLQIVIRYSNPSLTSSQFQSVLLQAIRDEFEHNLSQQLYVSDVSWNKVINAKEECIKQVNFSASKLNSNAPANDLGGLIIQNFTAISPNPIQDAIKQMKQDVQSGL